MPETAKSILAELKSMGRESYKATMMRHGAKEPIYGVSVADMKKIVKRVKVSHELAIALYDSGVYDAQYLAGLIADDMAMTKKDLQRWAKQANAQMICNFTVPWVAAGSDHGWELGLEWIDSKQPGIAGIGWATLASLVAIKPDAELDIAGFKKLLDRVAKTIHSAPNNVRYVMNNFVISVGGYVKPLSDVAIAAAKKIGKVTVDMGDTECQVPDAFTYIDKMKKRGTLGKKRKSAKC